MKREKRSGAVVRLAVGISLAIMSLGSTGASTLERTSIDQASPESAGGGEADSSVTRSVEVATQADVTTVASSPRPRKGPVRLDFRYDRETGDHFIGVILTLPGGHPHCICVSGHQPGGNSITWDVILNPVLKNGCKAAAKAGLCELT